MPQTEQPIQRLDKYKDGRIVFLDRDEPGRGHAFQRTECIDLAEGVQRMGYTPGLECVTSNTVTVSKLPPPPDLINWQSPEVAKAEETVEDEWPYRTTTSSIDSKRQWPWLGRILKHIPGGLR
jgi:hypothetical protein